MVRKKQLFFTNNPIANARRYNCLFAFFLLGVTEAIILGNSITTRLKAQGYTIGVMAESTMASGS